MISDAHARVPRPRGDAGLVSPASAKEPVAAETQPLLPSRFSDRPTSARARLFGMGGTSAIALFMLAAAFITWRSHTAPEEPMTLSVFDVAPPAPPAEPARDVPIPEKVQEERRPPDPVRSKIEPSLVSVPPLASAPAAIAKPVADPLPAVREEAPSAPKPPPPVPQPSSAEPTWQGLVLGALNKVKRYPRDAHLARHQGVPIIRFVMDRQGRVLAVQLERGSGVRTLDREALALPRRAQPLPRPPEDVAGDTIELVVPVEFFMR